VFFETVRAAQIFGGDLCLYRRGDKDGSYESLEGEIPGVTSLLGKGGTTPGKEIPRGKGTLPREESIFTLGGRGHLAKY